ncbi:MAG: peptidoglycan-binding protein [Selenomonadales bacterium]|nr:peptidoglycan-binding protein [Selenomonadales bacterium]
MRRLSRVLIASIALVLLLASFLWQPRATASSLYSVLTQVMDMLQREYWRDIDGKTLVQGALQGIVNALDDEHAYYIPPEVYGLLLSQVTRTQPGIGVKIEIAPDGAKIAQLYRASPALSAGLKIGDVITAVDGRAIKGLGIAQVMSQLDGEVNTLVRLTYYSGDPASVQTVSLTRQWVTPPSAAWGVHQGYGYIRILTFGEHLAADVKDALEALKDTPGIILDLRDCQGGSMQSLMAVTQYFVPQGLMGFVESRGQRQPLRSPGPGPAKPFVALVNAGTASAAEILAAGMKYSGTLLVGEITYGKGTAQRWHDLGPELGGIIYTVGNYLDITGARIDGRGLTPNVIVGNTFTRMPQAAERVSEESTLRYGTKSAEVVKLQKGLRLLGYYVGEITGIYDTNTASAVSRFQQREGLAADGVAAVEDIRLLNQRLHVPPSIVDNQLDRAVNILRNPPRRP